MANSPSKTITKIAPIFLSACACLGVVPTTPAHAGFFRDTNLTCVDLNRRSATHHPYKQALYGILANATRSSIGLFTIDNARHERISLCFDHSLKHKNKCGMSFNGKFAGGKVRINPDNPSSSQIRTAVHEARHGYQHEIGLNWGNVGANYSPAERIATYTAMEADSRVISILYAWEMANNGNPAHLAEMKQEPWHAHMVKAFEETMNETNNDVAASAAQAFLAFRNIEMLAKTYDFQVAYAVQRNRSYAYNPQYPSAKILTADRLYAMGDLGHHGNYMSEDIRSYLNNLANESSLNNPQKVVSAYKAAMGFSANASLTCR